MKSSRKAAGVTEIRIPGERSRLERARRLREGVPIEEEVWQEVAGIARELRVPLPA